MALSVGSAPIGRIGNSRFFPVGLFRPPWEGTGKAARYGKLPVRPEVPEGDSFVGEDGSQAIPGSASGDGLPCFDARDAPHRKPDARGQIRLCPS